jgi:ABC-2 type transport system permease protein
MSVDVTSAPTSYLRNGVGAWVSSYRAMLRWELLGARLLLPVVAVVQVLVGVGFVIGFGLLIPDVGTDAALYLATGAVVMSLILIGLVVTPQLIAQQKMEGSYDYVRSLPVPRPAAMAASITVAALIAVPSVLAAVGVAMWRYDITFDLTPAALMACALTLLCGCLLGAAVAHGVAEPQVTLLFTQLGIFFLIGFSPVNFPIERLPGWLATLHQYLPFHHMAILVRSTFTDGLVEADLESWLVLVVWTALAGVVTGLVLARRK